MHEVTQVRRNVNGLQIESNLHLFFVPDSLSLAIRFEVVGIYNIYSMNTYAVPHCDLTRLFQKCCLNASDIQTRIFEVQLRPKGILCPY